MIVERGGGKVPPVTRQSCLHPTHRTALTTESTQGSTAQNCSTVNKLVLLISPSRASGFDFTHRENWHQPIILCLFKTKLRQWTSSGSSLISLKWGMTKCAWLGRCGVRSPAVATATLHRRSQTGGETRFSPLGSVLFWATELQARSALDYRAAAITDPAK